MSAGISAQGTLVARNSVTMGELKDITPPALSRKSIETTAHNDSDDFFVVGIRRRGELQLKVNYLPSGDQAALGAVTAWKNGTLENYKITFPDSSFWMFSGYMIGVSPTAPSDNGLEATLTIRPTGTLVFG